MWKQAKESDSGDHAVVGVWEPSLAAFIPWAPAKGLADLPGEEGTHMWDKALTLKLQVELCRRRSWS